MKGMLEILKGFVLIEWFLMNLSGHNVTQRLMRKLQQFCSYENIFAIFDQVRRIFFFSFILKFMYCFNGIQESNFLSNEIMMNDIFFANS